jgi:hypothetical protein
MGASQVVEHSLTAHLVLGKSSFAGASIASIQYRTGRRYSGRFAQASLSNLCKRLNGREAVCPGQL